MLVLSTQYEKLSEMAKTFLNKCGLQFDYDIFAYTLLKCNDISVTDETQFNDCFRYFLKSLKNNLLKRFRLPEFVDLSEIQEDIPDEHNYSLDDMYDTEAIEHFIENEFGPDTYDLCLLHANGMSYDYMRKTYGIKNFGAKFRKVKQMVNDFYNKKPPKK